VDRVQRHAAVVLFTAAGVAYFLDRISKAWVERSLPGKPVDLIPGIFTLRFTTNSGGAFSIGGSTPWIFATATIVVSIVIVATAFRHRSTLTAIALGLILGGALGNLTDRIVRGPGFSGQVVDFVDLHVWPIFNVADSAIVVGAMLLAIGSFRSDRRDPEDPT
jgi:signal peptidase II